MHIHKTCYDGGDQRLDSYRYKNVYNRVMKV